jgi:phage gpG-like protein
MSQAPNIKREIEASLKALVHLRDRVLPVKVGRAAVAQVKDNFRKGGIDGNEWDEPYRRRLSFNGTAGRYGPLLSGTNTLMDANRYEPQKGRVVVKNELPYAEIQNDGGTIRVTAKMKRFFWAKHIEAKGSMRLTKSGRKSRGKYNQALSREAEFWRNMALKKVGSTVRMPARKFLGESRSLTDVVNKTIAKELDNFVKNYGKSSGTPR